MSKGFTLVEMMVVVAIVAVLALMMVPAYNDRAVRDQIAEALPLADIAKKPVAAAWAAAQALPGRQRRRRACRPRRRS